MTTVATDLDWVQARLHDSGDIWTRAELLDWYLDGYETMLWESKAVRRFAYYDLPPRYCMTTMYEWETQFTNRGPSRMMSFPTIDAAYRCTGLWEVTFLDGSAPSDARVGITQDWERVHVDEVDHHYIFALPRQFDLLLDARWNHRPLGAATVREFDETDDAWMRRVGEPWWYSSGTGRINSIELYNIQTTYQQAYAITQFDQYGFPRTFSGSRTWAVQSAVREAAYAYTCSGDIPNPLLGFGWRFTYLSDDSESCTQLWEKEWLNGDTTFTDGVLRGTSYFEQQHGVAITQFGIGTIRGISSPDRQYLGYGGGPALNNLYGGVRAFGSSDQALEVLMVVVPDGDLSEADSPDLIPTALQKYLRYYTLHRAFGRQGPGQNPALSQHFAQRFAEGVAFLKTLADASGQDRVAVRESDGGLPDGRPPYVRLPATYESW